MVIDLNAADWKTTSDFYNALLAALGAPQWHGTSVNALLDSMIWGGVNAVKPPYTVRIRNTRVLTPDIKDTLNVLSHYINEGKRDYREQEGHDLDVHLELIP